LFKYCKPENKNKIVQLLNTSQVKEILENKNIHFAWGKSNFSSNNQPRLYAINPHSFLTQKNIKEAKEEKTNSFSNQINLSLDSIGTSIFKNKTSENRNKYIAITWDDEVFSAPRVMQEIPGGKVSITGLTDDLLHSKDIVFILESGVLPSKMNFHSINSISKNKN
jgi:SecD/SecF fusion protein